MLNLEKERENAPKMRREHLQDRLDIARLKGDVASEQEIIRIIIIKREAFESGIHTTSCFHREAA